MCHLNTYHYHQDEIFHVEQGELKVVINGEEYFAEKGKTIIVPKVARHIASNNKPEKLTAIVEYTPGLDMETFFKCFCGLRNDGQIDKNGGVSIPMMGYCLKEMKCKAMARPTNIPKPMFNIAFNIFHLMGIAKGRKNITTSMFYSWQYH
jgi:hypothetical protein